MSMPSQLAKAKRRNYRRPLFENLPSLDMRWLARHDMIPRDWDRRVYPDFSWINPAFPRLVITPRVIEVFCRDGRQQIAPIHWQAISGMCQGATRPIFGCPCCRNHTFKLYDVYGELYCWKCAFAPRRPLCLTASVTQRASIPTKPTSTPLPRRISRLQHNPQAAVHAPEDLQRTSSQTAPDRS
jgi:hypothetical protein